jgi:hypothetical protein
MPVVLPDLSRASCRVSQALFGKSPWIPIERTLDPARRTLLVAAVHAKNFRLIAYLREQGLSPCWMDASGRTAISVACETFDKAIMEAVDEFLQLIKTPRLPRLASLPKRMWILTPAPAAATADASRMSATFLPDLIGYFRTEFVSGQRGLVMAPAIVFRTLFEATALRNE